MNVMFFDKIVILIKLNFLKMGSHICCDQGEKMQMGILNAQVKVQSRQNKHLSDDSFSIHEKDPQNPNPQFTIRTVTAAPQKITSPQTYPYVQATLDRHHFFEERMREIKPVIKQIRGDVYEGEIDDEKEEPNGLGKMHKSDGSLYIGEFIHGQAEGNGVLIFPDGSYFNGWFVDNMASCKSGCFESEDCRYEGGLQNNLFQGFGRQRTSSYAYQGEYRRGKRTKGILTWIVKGQQIIYEGTFNQNQQFHGKGILTDQYGTYEGDFVNGLKQGSGEFIGNNGVIYEGEYRQGLKEGEGTIFSKKGTIAYKGEFKNGLPHGKGISYTGEKQVAAIWNQGINQNQIDSEE